MIGSPEKLINQVIKNTENREWTMNLITLKGPSHKQIQHTLVLKRLEKLASRNKKRRVSLTFSKEQTITSDCPESETLLPISIRKKSLEALSNTDEVLEKLSKGPQHEALYTALLLQVIEAMIAAQENKVVYRDKLISSKTLLT